MTTPTPISEGGVGSSASAPLEFASLARLANELFAAPPAGAPGIAALGRSDVAELPATPGAAEGAARQATGAVPTPLDPSCGRGPGGGGDDARSWPWHRRLRPALRLRCRFAAA